MIHSSLNQPVCIFQSSLGCSLYGCFKAPASAITFARSDEIVFELGKPISAVKLKFTVRACADHPALSFSGAPRERSKQLQNKLNAFKTCSIAPKTLQNIRDIMSTCKCTAYPVHYSCASMSTTIRLRITCVVSFFTGQGLQ